MAAYRLSTAPKEETVKVTMPSLNRLERIQHWSVSIGFVLLSLAFNCLTGRAQSALPLDPPQLVVVIIVDGFPAEQLTKYSDQFGPGGLRLLMDEGAWFSDAHYGHAVPPETHPPAASDPIGSQSPPRNEPDVFQAATPAPRVETDKGSLYL